MPNTHFIRSLATLGLSWGALACAPGGSAEQDSTAADSTAAAPIAASHPVAASDTTVPMATDSPRADTSVRPTSNRTPIRTIGAPGGAIRAGTPASRGMDSVIEPDFRDSTRRLRTIP